MAKYIRYMSTFIIGTMAATYSHASQDLAPQKTEYTFYITLSEKDNPIKIGVNRLLDKSDKFACRILNLSWPKKGDNQKLWRIEESAHIKTGDTKSYPARWMSLNDFSNTVTKNSLYSENFAHGFPFPQAFSDATIQELVKNRKITNNLENGTIIHLILQNSKESLKRIGLPERIESPRVFFTSGFFTKSTDSQKPLNGIEPTEETKSPSSSFRPYLFIGSIAGLSFIAYLLKKLS